MTTPPIQTGSNYQGTYPALFYHNQGNPTGWIPFHTPATNTSNDDMKKIGKAALFLIGEIALVYLAVRFGHSRGWDKGWDAGYDIGWDKGKDSAEQKCKRELNDASIRSFFEKLGIYTQFFVDALRR